MKVTSLLTVPPSPSMAPTLMGYSDRGTILVPSIVSSFLSIFSNVSLLSLPAWTATDVTIILKRVPVCVYGKDCASTFGGSGARMLRSEATLSTDSLHRLCFLLQECASALRGSSACDLSAESGPCTFLRTAETLLSRTTRKCDVYIRKESYAPMFVPAGELRAHRRTYRHCCCEMPPLQGVAIPAGFLTAPRREHYHCWREMLPLRGSLVSPLPAEFLRGPRRVSLVHDTSLQSNMKV